MPVGVVTNIAGLRAQTNGSAQAIYVEGYSNPDDGGQGLFIYTPSDTTSADNGGTVIIDAAGDRWKRDFTGPASVRWFGARGDGSTNDTTAIQAALNATQSVFLPAGTYVTSATLNITLDGAEVSGDSSADTFIRCSGTNFHCLTCRNSISNFTLSHLTLDRTGTATAGADGAHFDSPVNLATINDVNSQNNYNGFYLGAMNGGSVNNCSATNNVNHGFTFQPSAAGVGPSQWAPFNCVSTTNGGDGFNYSNPTTGPTTLSVSTMTDCSTYANTGRGIAAVGASSSHTVAAMRVEGGFFGQDNGHEVFLDTYDGGHVIKATYIELAGTTYTGRNSNAPSRIGTPPSNVSVGVYISLNNRSTEINGGVINGNSYDGVFTSGTTTNIVGATITNNGLALASGRRNGVYVFNQGNLTNCLITGCNLSDTGANAQAYGIVSNIDALAVAGCYLNGNLTAPTSIPAGSVSAIAGCVPRSVNR